MKYLSQKKQTNYKLLVLVAVFIVSFISSSFITRTSLAAGCDEDFYSSNDIFFYSACFSSSATSCNPSAIGEISVLRGKDNAEKIYNFWTDAGMTKQQAAGITASIKHESGFSPFRQETSKTWPAGGWGIAQFTGEQRKLATTYVKKAISEDVFNDYYKNEYGGGVTQSSGYIPDGVPADINEQFLLAELNYLLDYSKGYKPNSIRRGWMQEDYNKEVSSSIFLYDYLKTIETPGDAAIAWTYLYEAPANHTSTGVARAESAKEMYKLLTGAAEGGESCAPVSMEAGMTKKQAEKFMETYEDIKRGDPNGDKKYLGGAQCHTLTDNCVRFSSYFINKYTDITFNGGNGGFVVNKMLEKDPTLESGKTPRPFSVFSIHKGRTMCGNIPCGHTGVVLGVDTEKGIVITGEAAWCDDGYTGVYTYSLKDWTDGEYTFLYAADRIKPDMKGALSDV